MEKVGSYIISQMLLTTVQDFYCIIGSCSRAICQTALPWLIENSPSYTLLCKECNRDTDLAHDFCWFSDWLVAVVLLLDYFFSPCKRLRMAAHPQRATEELCLSRRATATRSTKTLLVTQCLFLLFSVQVYGVLPSALQHQFWLLLWEECQLLWLWGGCSEGGVSPAKSQDHHYPHQPSGQSLLLVPGQFQGEVLFYIWKRCNFRIIKINCNILFFQLKF